MTATHATGGLLPVDLPPFADADCTLVVPRRRPVLTFTAPPWLVDPVEVARAVLEALHRTL